MDSDAPTKRVGLRCQASSFDPCSFFIFRETRGAAGAFTTHMDDILGCAEPDVPPEIRDFSERRLGELKLQESSPAHVGMGLVREGDFSGALTNCGFTRNLKPPPTSPRLWVVR